MAFCARQARGPYLSLNLVTEPPLTKLYPSPKNLPPHVRESKTVLDFGFHAVDFGFQVLDS